MTQSAAHPGTAPQQRAEPSAAGGARGIRRSAGRRRHERAGQAVRVALAVVISAVTVFPLYWMVVVAFSTRAELLGGDLRLWPRTFTMANFDRVFSAFPVATWFGNSVAITLVVALLTMGVSMSAGYAFAQLRFPGSSLLFFVSLATLMLPVQVIMVPLFRLVSQVGLYGSYWAVIPAHVGVGVRGVPGPAVHPRHPARTHRGRHASTAPVTGASSCRSSCRCRGRCSPCSSS